jgi:hypothetical protein
MVLDLTPSIFKRVSVTEATAMLIHACSTTLQTFGRIHGSLLNPKRGISITVIPVKEGAKGLARSAESIYLEKFYSEIL